MTGMLRHRGPDDRGEWTDAEAGVALGHTRLAIIDTSPAGHQPMTSHDGRFVMVFNGEIYNHMELRRGLEASSAAPNWGGHSDTETLLAAIVQWGLAETLRRAKGMFAVALWDRERRMLQLARDRLGEKPLHYGWAGTGFVFASEIKAIKAHPAFAAKLCHAAADQYLRFGYVPAPLSIWEGVWKLEPGCILSVSGLPARSDTALRPGQSRDGMTMSRYWSLAETVDEGHADEIRDEAQAIDALEETLSQAVSRQMISDVPLGAFLSGGIDSSLVVALMQKSSATPVRSFTVGFDEQDFDESRHAAAVARHIGTQHTEIRVTSAEARAAIPLMPSIFDEPFADASQIPTFLISQQARAQVTVALTGDAGDELFGGYARYERAPKLWEMFRRIPVPLRRGLGGAITAVPTDVWDRLAPKLGDGKQPQQLGDRLHRLGVRLRTVRSVDDIYMNLVSSWPDPRPIEAFAVEDMESVPSLIRDALPPAVKHDAVARMMYLDALTYLPDDILCKVDRTAMSVSLETRAPLLDPDVVALAARLPVSMKVRDGQGKWVFRQVLHRHVPRALVERPKLGFFLPIGRWLRGPLRDWAEGLLEPQRLEAEGLLSPGPVQRMWREHVSGQRDWTLQAWTILMFQAWAEYNL